jgi:LacI family transcriptional regulator
MKLARRPTILDVARHAGVSVGTASNVLNDRVPVSDTRRELVLAAARELGYRPNETARSLRRQRTRIVGLAVPLTASAYFAALVEAFEAVAGSLGYAIMQVITRGEPDLEIARVEALLGHRIDGLVVVPSAAPARLLDLIAGSGVPAVLVDRFQEDERFDQVGIDDAGAMRAVAGRLIELGHRRLLFAIRHPELVTTQARVVTFEAVVAQAGATGELLVRADEPGPFAADLLRRVEGFRPTAVIASNSIIAQWTLRALQAAGLRWPVDLSVVAFDEPSWSEIVDPPLSVVRQPVEAMARTAWEMLLARLDDPGLPVGRVALPVELVWRASCAPPTAGGASSSERRARRARAS